MNHLSAEDIAEIKRLVVDHGFTTAQLAARFKVSERSIQRHRQELGIPGMVRPVLTDEQLRRIEDMVEDGCPFNEIARTLGVSANMIQKRFKGRGSGENLASCRALREKLGLIWKGEDE